MTAPSFFEVQNLFAALELGVLGALTKLEIINHFTEAQNSLRCMFKVPELTAQQAKRLSSLKQMRHVISVKYSTMVKPTRAYSESLDKIRSEISKLEGQLPPAISLKLPPNFSESGYASVELSPIPKRRQEVRESINSLITKLTTDPKHFTHDPLVTKILSAQPPSSPQFKLRDLNVTTPQTPSTYSEVSVSEFFSKMMVQAETLTPRH
mmetsp:Transcript_20922/g.38774  ORF Transcript_20922/g.38774 Transcript_20922/m.38774 type:complete len:209 (-) Transcript_20922:8-634(-)